MTFFKPPISLVNNWDHLQSQVDSYEKCCCEYRTCRCQWGIFSLISPYTQVPAMALNKVTIITRAPVPIKAYKGPGHAPVNAHPKPKINPPKICPLLNFFG